MAQYISAMSEAIKEAHNKLWSRLARKPDAAAATSASPSDAITVSDSHLISPTTDLPKAITDLLKARASHNPLKDRVEPLGDDNLDESGSEF